MWCRFAVNTVEGDIGRLAAATQEEDEMHTAYERSLGASDEITIRLSGPHDRAAILRLANLDGRRPPSGQVILAIVSGELRAALPLGGGDAIADPFRPTTELVEVLRVIDAAQRSTGAGGRRPSRMRVAAAVLTGV
jgi:hypothetical protein